MVIRSVFLVSHKHLYKITTSKTYCIPSAQSLPDDLVASISGDPHVLVKNGDAADHSQYFCFDIVALPDHQYVTILEDSSKLTPSM